MTWITTATTSAEQERNANIAVLPVGSFEQHGPHLPMTTDSIVAGVLAKQIADSYDLRLLPPIMISCSHEHAAWIGTVSISASTLSNIIADVRESLSRQGVDRLAIINGHGGNYALSNVVQQANALAGTPVVSLYPGRNEWRSARAAAQMVTSDHDDMHAGELETSILLYAAPELVGGTYVSADHLAPDRPHLLMTGLAEYTDSGVVGRPSLATATKGLAVIQSLSEQFSTHLKLLS
jgi:creatinine amidohydrolase